MSEIGSVLKEKLLSKFMFGCFLLSVPLSIRKVFFVFSPDGRWIFNEYTDISVYLSDVTLLLLFLIIIIENKKYILSILWWRKMFHVEQLLIPLAAPIPFLCWSGFSVLWSRSEYLALFACIKLFEGYLLYTMIFLFIVPRGTMGNFFKKCSTWNNSSETIQAVSSRESMFHVEQSIGNYSKKIVEGKNVLRGTFRSLCNLIRQKCSTWNNWYIISSIMIFIGLSQGFLSIVQFFSQSSLGLTFLKESSFSAYQPGVAKIIIGNDVFIRSYGLFPHPNILGGFMGITVLFTITHPILFKKMFHVEQVSRNYSNKSVVEGRNVPRGTIRSLCNLIRQKCSTWNNQEPMEFSMRKMFHVERSILIYRIVVFIEIFGFLLTFSKAAVLSLILALTYYFYRLFHVEQLTQNCSEGNIIEKNVPRGTIKNLWNSVWGKCSTWNNKKSMEFSIGKMFHVEHLYHYLLGGIALGTAIYFLSKVDWYYFFIQPMEERIFINHELIAVLSQYSLSGIGIGQSVLMMQDFFFEKLMIWQFQPIHNLFLLVIAETGIIGFILFGYFLSSLVYRECVPQKTYEGRMLRILIVSAVIFMMIISLFDHYFWDIQQGQLLFWLLLGLLVASSGKKLTNNKYIA